VVCRCFSLKRQLDEDGHAGTVFIDKGTVFNNVTLAVEDNPAALVRCFGEQVIEGTVADGAVSTQVFVRSAAAKLHVVVGPFALPPVKALDDKVRTEDRHRGFARKDHSAGRLGHQDDGGFGRAEETDEVHLLVRVGSVGPYDGVSRRKRQVFEVIRIIDGVHRCGEGGSAKESEKKKEARKEHPADERTVNGLHERGQFVSDGYRLHKYTELVDQFTSGLPLYQPYPPHPAICSGPTCDINATGKAPKVKLHLFAACRNLHIQYLPAGDVKYRQVGRFVRNR